MDRITYLSSLPFLIPLQSKVWPPMRIPKESEHRTVHPIVLGCCSHQQQQQQLKKKKKNDEYYSSRSGTVSGSGNIGDATAVAVQPPSIPLVVSIELVPSSSSTITTRAAAAAPSDTGNTVPNHHHHRILYFSTTTKASTTMETEDGMDIPQLDPTLTSVEMAVLGVQYPPPSHQQHQQQPLHHSNISATSSVQVYLRIQETYVFLLKTDDCHCISLPSETMTTTTTMDGDTMTPPCLLLQFRNTNIQFRIFSLSPHPNHCNTTGTSTTNDHVLQGIFQNVVNVFEQCHSNNIHNNNKYHSMMIPITVDIDKKYRLPIPQDNDDRSSSPTSTNHKRTSSSATTTTTTESSTLLHNRQIDVAIVDNNGDEMTTKQHSTSNLAFKVSTGIAPPPQSPPSTLDTTSDQIATTLMTSSTDDENKHTHRNRLQQYLQVRNQSLSSLEQIHQILHMPVSSITNNSSNDNSGDNHNNSPVNESSSSSSSSSNDNTTTVNGNNNATDTAGPIQTLSKGSLSSLLNLSALRTSQSYLISDTERHSIQTEYDIMLQQLQTEQMDSVLNTYFVPSSLHQLHRHKRRKLQQQSLISSAQKSRNDAAAVASPAITNHHHPGRTANANDPATPTVTMDTTIHTMTNLMMEQKRLIQERYQTLLLPSRGYE